MALLGLRPHECWLGSWNNDGTYTVHGGKTGKRLAIAFELQQKSEWLRMAMGPLPEVTANENRDYGSRLNKVFSRAGINKDGGWSPYCLRHRWVALSARLNKLDESVLAAAAGHTVATRRRTYKSLIDENHVLGAAEQNGYTLNITQFLNSKDD
jgi:integrase